jgi:hypothetical protein
MVLLQRLFFLAIFTLLSGCGGSGDGGLSRDETPSTGEPDESTVTLVLSINDTDISNANPALVTATLQEDGVSLSGKVITYSTTLGILDPLSGTALTDENGQATIQIHAGAVEGAGEITAEYGAVSSSILGFTSAGDGGEVAAGKVINITSSNATITAATPATLSATITDGNEPVIGEVVTFTTTLGVLDPISGTALTGTDGVATIVLAAGTQKGAGLITVTTVSGESNTLGFSTEGDGSEEGGNALTITTFTNSTSISDANSASITIHFEAANGTDLSNEVITFTSTLGVFDPVTGTVLTNSTGDATIILSAGTVRGAGVLTASSSAGDVVTQGFFSQGDGSVAGGNALTITTFTNSTSISNANPASITVHFEAANGTDLDNEVITFTSTLGVLNPATGTVLTNSTGDATILLSAGTIRGAGVLTASSRAGDVVTQGFFSQGDSVGSGVNINLALTDFNGNEIDQISSISSGKLTATVTGVNKAVIVTFTTDLGTIPIQTAIATTGSGYIATVDLLSGNSLGAGTVTAQLATGESQNLVFSIGVPVGAISAGATAGLSVSIWDISSATPSSPATLFTIETVDVTFSSGCSGLSVPTAKIDSPVATIAGVAQSTY